MNFYKHHIGDYDADTSHLSWLEDAAYRRLMCLYYRREQPIPRDIAQACRLIRATSRQEREAVEQVLREFFVETDDGWRNRRCDGEIEAAQEKAQRNRDVGKMGGRPRKTATQTEPNGNPDGFQTATQTEPNGNPLQTPDSRLQSNTPPASQSPPAGGATTKRGSRIPSDWHPDDAGMAFAASLLNGGSRAELDRFRDHWAAQPGQRGVKADWAATWRNWCRRAADDRRMAAARRSAGNHDAEPAWRTDQRERNEDVLGPYAARRSKPTPPTTAEVIDATARIVG